MKQVVVFVAFVLLFSSFGFTSVQNILPKISAAVPDNKTDSNNPNLSYTPKPTNLSASEKNTTVGQKDELRVTMGNASQYNKPGFNASKPVEDFDKNASQLPQIHRGQPFPGGT